MNLDESVPPNVSSPLLEVAELVGSKETATRLEVMTPLEKRLSVTVGKGLRCAIVNGYGIPYQSE